LPLNDLKTNIYIYVCIYPVLIDDWIQNSYLLLRRASLWGNLLRRWQHQYRTVQQHHVVREKRVLYDAIFDIKKPLVYQDRLGTNIGKAPQTKTRFP
jgi:hypothetical protein